MQKVKVFLRRFIARYLSPFVEFFYRIKFKFSSIKTAPVIILTPGKVGSSSVYETLKRKIEHPVFHIHRFSQRGIAKSIDEHLNSDRKSRPLHLIISKLLKEKLKDYEGQIYVITIIREPVARTVSSFFQNTESYRSQVEKKGLKIDEDKAKELLSNKLNFGIIEQLEEWFTEEIEVNFGVKVFEEKFDTSKNYLIKRKENFHFLLLKMENLDSTFPLAIKEFLNSSDNIELEKANIGAEKHYSDSYKRVKREISIDKQELEKIIASRYCTKFYPDSADSVMQKWGKS